RSIVKLKKEAAMRNDRVLLILVVADVVLVMLTIAAEVVLTPALPEPLRHFTGLPGWSLANFVRLTFWIGIALVTMVSWIGLLQYWWPARILYVGSWAAWIVLVLASGPSVTTAAGATIETIDHLVGGAIIGLVYFSDLQKRFEERELETV